MRGANSSTDSFFAEDPKLVSASVLRRAEVGGAGRWLGEQLAKDVLKAAGWGEEEGQDEGETGTDEAEMRDSLLRKRIELLKSSGLEVFSQDFYVSQIYLTEKRDDTRSLR